MKIKQNFLMSEPSSPCATRNTTPEAVGDAAILVDPRNIDEIRVAMGDVLENEGLRRRLVDKGKQRVCSFKWGGAAKKLLQVYERVVGR